MNKAISWIIWSLVFVSINIGALPIAAFSLFGTSEGTSIFSLDYLVAFAIIGVANIVSIQLFVSLRKQDQKRFLVGLIFAILEVCSFILLLNGAATALFISLATISILGAIILLIISIKR